MQKDYCYAYTSEFHEKARKRNDLFGEQVTKFINIVLVANPYNSRLESYRKIFSQNKFINKDMKAFAVVVKNVLALWRHIVVLSSMYHFRGWYQLFPAVKKKQNGNGMLGNEINDMIKRSVITVGSKSLKFVRTNRYYNCSPGNVS